MAMSSSEPITMDELDEGVEVCEPGCDYEHPRLDINAFVTDYFSWRIEQSGSEWHERPELPFGVQPEHIAMREVATIFERRHAAELRQFALELMEDEEVSFNRYTEIMEEFGRSQDELPKGMSYGRLVGLFAFGGVVASELAARGWRRQLQQIAQYTARFIDQRIRLTWKDDERSWEKFMKMAVDIRSRMGVRREREEETETRRRRESRRWSLLGIAAAGVVGIGAITLSRVLLSK